MTGVTQESLVHNSGRNSGYQTQNRLLCLKWLRSYLTTNNKGFLSFLSNTHIQQQLAQLPGP